MNVVIKPGQAPFHYGLFFGAVRQFLGEPTHKTDMGGSGYYDYYWEMTPEFKQILRHEQIRASIGEWMKCFDLQWPESRCDIAKWPNSPDQNKEYFRITISCPVPKES